MRTYVKRQVTETTDVIDKALCNRCGKDITTPDIEHGCIEGFHIAFDGGYHSGRDGEHIELDLCDECCDMLLSSLVHPATITNYM